jgi:TetR/AcrR family transcriptional regulator, transcriptional repressor for nem operon
VPRKSVAETQHSRQSILASAARLMRERGYDGVGIDAIVADAGLTPGAFYTHFNSKAALFTEVVQQALARAERHLPAIDTEADIETFVRFYLSNKMVRELGAGCIVAAMSGDLARQSAGAREAAAQYIALIQSRIERALHDRLGEAAMPESWRIAAQLVGAVVIARIVPPALGQQVLDAARAPALPARQRKV